MKRCTTIALRCMPIAVLLDAPLIAVVSPNFLLFWSLCLCPIRPFRLAPTLMGTNRAESVCGMFDRSRSQRHVEGEVQQRYRP